eukprot:11101437-Alexandrium_andersonii.AAC.1
MLSLTRPRVIETAAPQPGRPNIFNLPEFVELSRLAGVKTVLAAQRVLGRAMAEPTAIMGTLVLDAFNQRTAAYPASLKSIVDASL